MEFQQRAEQGKGTEPAAWTEAHRQCAALWTTSCPLHPLKTIDTMPKDEVDKTKSASEASLHFHRSLPF